MNFEKQFEKYKDMEQIVPKEEKIADAVRSSKAAFYKKEQARMLSYREFLWNQSKFVQKKWWIIQLLLLACVWALMIQSETYTDMQKTMGAAAPLFIVLIIPELWKNRSCCSLEVEGTAFYSLRQVYAARMLLFVLADVLLISAFFAVASIAFQLTLIDLMTQFLLPLSVTACICFRTLCSKRGFSDAIAAGLCIFWDAVWTLVILNEAVYTKIAPPVWLILLGGSVFYLYRVIRRTLNTCNNYWEEQQIWN